MGRTLGPFAELPRERARCNLHEATASQPFNHTFGIGDQRVIPLRMCDDGHDSRCSHPKKRFIHARWDCRTWEFDEKVLSSVDGVLGSIPVQVFDIVVRGVKFTAEPQLTPVPKPLLEGCKPLAVEIRAEGVVVARVGRADDVCHSFGDRGFRQRQTFLYRGRSVIEAEEQVIVSFDHTLDLNTIMPWETASYTRLCPRT